MAWQIQKNLIPNFWKIANASCQSMTCSETEHITTCMQETFTITMLLQISNKDKWQQFVLCNFLYAFSLISFLSMSLLVTRIVLLLPPKTLPSCYAKLFYWSMPNLKDTPVSVSPWHWNFLLASKVLLVQPGDFLPILPSPTYSLWWDICLRRRF